MSAVLLGEDEAVTVSSWPAAVFTKKGWMSIIGVDEVAKGEFMKMRYTLPAKSEEDAEAACKFAYGNLQSFRRKMNEERGIVKSGDNRLLNLLRAMNDEKT
ncbi:MAG: hypothetical protein ABJN69_16265 [Hellea sp.]